MISSCFTLLDDATARTDMPRSRLYTDHVRSLTCTDHHALPDLLAQMQTAVDQGLYAVVLWHYELGAALHGMTTRHTSTPLAEVLLFSRLQHLGATEVEAWLTAQTDKHGSACAGITGVHANITQETFEEAIEKIRAYIAAGDTYQVNYTFQLHFTTYGSAHALYQKLRARQPVPYGAFITLPDGRAVLSLSPELLIQHAKGQLTARPMKGTAPASDDTQENIALSAALANDTKNRAENLMIVDLLRNDISRIAQLGTVTVPHLFDVNRFSRVLQMTSTITAQLRDDVSLMDIVTALYPCGSITGAPKLRTMHIIEELEASPRGLYTGAIGWFDPPAVPHTVGDFCLSVPIRTLVLDAPHNDSRTGSMGIGAGITYDSHPADEYAECLLKGRFLTGLPHDFALFETMHATHEEGIRHLDRHLARLRQSAAFFDFTYDDSALRTQLATACASLPAHTAHRMRLALSANAEVSLQSAPLSALTTPVVVYIAQQTLPKEMLFLRHKSTVRAHYDAAWTTAERHGGFDMLFFNTDGVLTEGGRSNVFVRIDNQWVTPPLSAGVLPGIMRGVLLEQTSWSVMERNITRAELARADEVIICNALRGAMQATIDFTHIA